MEIVCKRCGERVPESDVNADDQFAKCVSCDVVFDIRDPAERTARPREPVAMPPGLRVERTVPDAVGGPYRAPGRVREDLVVEWRWFHKKHVGTIGFTAFWWMVLIGFYTISSAHDEGWGMLGVVPLLFVGIGFGLIYICLALVMNTTRVTLEGDALRVAHRPIRWPGARSIPARDIVQLFCTMSSPYEINDRPVWVFNVNAQMRGADLIDDPIKLIKGLPEPGQALYIEQELERILSIVDRPVRGELDPDESA